MNASKQDKFVIGMVNGTNGGVPHYFGILPDQDGYKLYSEHKVYGVTRICAKIVNEHGQERTFDEHSKDFYCCFRQCSTKSKKNAFLLLDEVGQYVISSKEDWVCADIYVQAVPLSKSEDKPVSLISIWAHFNKRSDSNDICPKEHVVAVSTDFNVSWLLNALADSTFATPVDEKVDAEEVDDE